MRLTIPNRSRYGAWATVLIFAAMLLPASAAAVPFDLVTAPRTAPPPRAANPSPTDPGPKSAPSEATLCRSSSGKVAHGSACQSVDSQVGAETIVLCANRSGGLALRSEGCKRAERRLRTVEGETFCANASGSVRARSQCRKGETSVSPSLLQFCALRTGVLEVRTSCTKAQTPVLDAGFQISLEVSPHQAGEAPALEPNPLANAADGDLLDAIYADLLEIEQLFPVPQDSEEIEMGVVDVARGTYDGRSSTQKIDYFNGKPVVTWIAPRAEIGAVNAVLRFTFLSRGLLPLSIVANGVKTAVPAMQASISIDVGKVSAVEWYVQGPEFDLSDEIRIDRPEVIGAGAFQVEALPVSILYEPPQYGQGLSRTLIEVTESVGSSVSTGASVEQSQSRTGMVGFGSYASKLKGVGGAVAQSDNIYAKVIGTGLSVIGAAFDSTTVEEASDTKVSEDHRVDLLASETLTNSTSAGLGPGRGDRIIYLRDVRLAWVMDRGEVSLTVLDWESRAAYSVATLKADRAALAEGGAVVATTSGLSSEAIDELLALDPFATSMLFASLPAPRFRCIGLFEGDGSDSFGVAYSIREVDRSAIATFRTRVTQTATGWFSALYLGEDPSGSVLSTSHSSSRQVSVGETVSATMQIEATIASPYKLLVYYDTVFGTFLAREVKGLVHLGGGGACGGSGPIDVAAPIAF